MTDSTLPRPDAAVDAIDALDAEIAEYARRLAEAEAARTLAVAERRLGIVVDFDNGMRRAAIAHKWRVSYGTVAAVLHRAGRSEKTRRAHGLDPEQRRHYAAALAAGTPSVLARRIAEAVGR